MMKKMMKRITKANGSVLPLIIESACTLVIIGIAFSFSPAAFAQTPTQNQVNITDILIESFPFVSVEYDDPSTVVIRGDEESLLLANGTLTPFWEAIDKAKEQGFRLDDITASGMGSQGNPTRFYAVLSKYVVS